MIKQIMPVLISIVFGMLTCIVMQKILWAIYFSQLLILVFMTCFYADIKETIWESHREKIRKQL